ncbi:MAG: hypothetical protein NVS9B5_05580 [Terriglobales bacterium]
MAGRFATAEMAHAERAREQLRGDIKALDEFKFSLAKARGLQSFG